MKSILTLLLVLVTFEVSFEYTLPPSNKVQTVFWEAYDHVRKWEGNYSYLPYAGS